MADIDTAMMSYAPHLLELWKRQDYSMLEKSKASDYIKNILTFKAPRRKPGQDDKGTRFFGEAFVASQIPMLAGWYNSYQWLKWKDDENAWLTGNGLNKGKDEPINFRKIFYEQAIMKYIGVENLRKFHQIAKKVQKGNEHSSTYLKAPDLFIVDKKNSFLFLEVKLPGDPFDELQELALTMIEKHLKTSGNNPVIVKKIRLESKAR